MKKSLVISTIATVLVVVVALTTATFAWFSTSQAAVLTNSFAVATSGSGADIFKWNTDQNNYEATAASDWEMGQYSSPYEWTTPGKAATGTSGAITGYNPIMPVDLIAGTEYDGSNGLPSVEYLYADNQQTNGTATIPADGLQLHPIAVRFLLAPTYEQTSVKISATVSIPENPSRADIDAAKAFRFVMIGKGNGAATKEAQDFTFATNYKYLIDSKTPAAGAITEADYSDSGYVSTEPDAVATTTEIVTVANYSTIASGNTEVEQTITFKASSARQYDCVLYMWYDGSVVTNTTSNGTVELVLKFTGTNLATPAG